MTFKKAIIFFLVIPLNMGCMEEEKNKKDANISQMSQAVKTSSSVSETIRVGPEPRSHIFPSTKLFKFPNIKNPQPKIFFSTPIAHDQERVFMDSALYGELLVIDGCVQLKNTWVVPRNNIDGLPQSSSANSHIDWYTPIWPDHVKLLHTGGEYKLDINGKMLSFGEKYGFGGGSGVGHFIDSKVSGNCPETKIWYVGEVTNYRKLPM